jgi:hypothetical protein
MGTLYLRGSVWWCGFTDVDGERVLMSTGERSKPAARLFLKEVEVEVRRGARQATSMPTLKSFASEWLLYWLVREVAQSNPEGSIPHTRAARLLPVLQRHAQITGALVLKEAEQELDDDGYTPEMKKAILEPLKKEWEI